MPIRGETSMRVGLANDANSAAGDLLAGGQYRPAGDSLMGLSDMAGNAAEWTATPMPRILQPPGSRAAHFKTAPSRFVHQMGSACPSMKTAAGRFSMRCHLTRSGNRATVQLLNWLGR